MIFTSVAPVMAKLLGLFLTAAQIFDNRREEIGQDRAVLTASIQTVPLPSRQWSAPLMVDRLQAGN